jgi:hypothetical protein
MTSVNIVVDYMLNAASTIDKKKLYTKRPLLKEHSNEDEAIQYGNDYTREKSLWENAIVEATRSIEISTTKKLLLEELASRDKDIIHRNKLPTLSAVDRRLSSLSKISKIEPKMTDGIDKYGNMDGTITNKHSMEDTADVTSDDQSIKKIRVTDDSDSIDFSSSSSSSSSSADRTSLSKGK